MRLQEIKEQWNKVLDALLERDRILWLAIFDARLSDYSEGTLILDFQDSGKFATEHDFSYMRGVDRLRVVEQIASNVLGIPISIRIAE